MNEHCTSHDLRTLEKPKRYIYAWSVSQRIYGFSPKVDRQNDKLGTQVEKIEKLRKGVHELKDKMGDQERRLEA